MTYSTPSSSSSLPKRRSRGYSMDNIRVFAGSCIFIIVMGNLVMLQSYRSFVARQNVEDDSDTLNLVQFKRARRSLHGLSSEDVFVRYASEFLPYIGERSPDLQQYSVIEGRARKLMQQESTKEWWSRSKSKSNHNNNNMHQRDGRTSSSSRSFRGVSKMDAFGGKGNVANRARATFPGEGHRMATCVDVNRMQDLQYIGSGWTKAVYRGELDGREVAVKTVDINGHDMGECLKEGHNMTHCYAHAARKIVKEIVLLQSLAHENIIKVLGFCVPDRSFDGSADSAVAMVTELGEPIDQIKLLQMSWEDRLKVSYDVIKLIEFLSRSPYGSVALNDFRRNQFVLVNETVKLSDVDDAGFEEPSCSHQTHCNLKAGDSNYTKRLLCQGNHCQHHNEFLNILKTRDQFTSFLLPHGAPKRLRPIIDKIVQGFDTLRMNTKDILHEMEKVVTLYKAGAHLSRNTTSYKSRYRFYKKSDLPGLFDYGCRFTISGGSCTLSVFDLQEAEEICDYDEECQGFIWTQKKKWTGRTLVHFKNGKGVPSPNPVTDLYVKPS